MKTFDVTIIGAGPGGYVAAIRAAQLGLKVCLIEKEKVGGVCLNKGCIPTKALLESAHLIERLHQAQDHGIELNVQGYHYEKAVKRSQKIVTQLVSGIEFLLKKNKVTLLQDEATFLDPFTLRTSQEQIHSRFIIIATGAQYKTLPQLPINNKTILGAWEALKLNHLPKKIAIVGAGAIGMEFTYLWNQFGSEIHLFERENHLLPLEDHSISQVLYDLYQKKKNLKLHLGVRDLVVEEKNNKVLIQEESFDLVLSAVGMIGNSEFNLDLEKNGSFIQVNNYQQTNYPHIYAIGDVAGPPLLAHVASHEGLLAVEHLAGLEVHPMNKKFIPSCTYCEPQVASFGYKEQELEKNSYSVGIFPFKASGRALTSGESEGFVKIITGSSDEILGAHLIGSQVSELIHSLSLVQYLEGTSAEIFQSIFPHPTLSEALQEAFLQSKKRALHL